MIRCDVNGCDRPHYAKRYCSMHYQRWTQRGDASALRATSDGINITSLECSETDVAWIAGIVEGEGSLGVYPDKRDGSKRFVLTVTMTDKDIIDRLSRLTGMGSLHSRTRKLGKKRQYTWTVGAMDDVYSLVVAILPWLGQRRTEQATNLIREREAYTARPSGKKSCNQPDCERPHKAHGMCGMHYYRWMRHGDPTVVFRPYEKQRAAHGS